MGERTCSVHDCERQHYSKTMCSLHYNRMYRHGDPRSIRQIQIDRENATGLRICTACKLDKPLAAFRRCSRSLNGRKRECKPCFSSRVQVWYLESGKNRVQDNSRRNHLRKMYGLTVEEFHAMVDAQDERCAVCGWSECRLLVDHDHETGEVRGLLCHLCNVALGMAEDSVERLQELIAYLHKHRSTQL